MSLKKYHLKDGTVDWHRLYYDNVPRFMTRYSPPFGGYNYAHYAYKPQDYIREIFDHIKYFIQRGRRGWSDRDVWGWYNHHAEIMVGVLQYLRKYKHGYPPALTPAKWAKKLTSMEQGFQAVLDEDSDVTSYKTLSRAAYRKLSFSRRRKLMLGLKHFREYYYSIWD